MEATRVALPMTVPVPMPVPSSSGGARAQVSPRGAARPQEPPRGAARPQQHYKRQKNNVANKVIVSGYPPYTQPPDLIRVFKKIGKLNVDSLNAKSATLAFHSREDAKKAIEASTHVIVYGEFLTIEPYDGREAPEEVPLPHPPKRDFSRSKSKNVIIEPKDIDLSGSFHSQLQRVLAAVRLTQDQVAALCTLYTHLENALRGQWPGCAAVPFGSIPTGLGIKTSDADCFINIPVHLRPNITNPSPVNVANAHANLVNKAQRVLRQYPDIFAETFAIPRANTPIVKFFHIPTETNCDVTFKTPLGAQNSRLIAFLLHSDPRLLPVAVAIKYWARVHELSGTGRLTNYALTMLVIFYLQQPAVAILPAVHRLQRELANEHLVDGWNTGFDRAALPPCANASSIADLLGGFFTFYAGFDFEELVVCPLLGRAVRKEVFRSVEDMSGVPVEMELYRRNVSAGRVLPLRATTPLCVQDPYELCHNVALPVTTRLAADIKVYFKFAAAAYEREKATDCAGLLRGILLQKPKIIRGKLHPEYRVNLFPRFIVNIVDPEWRPIVRQVVREVFETMLKVELAEAEDQTRPEPAEPTPDRRRERERYTGVISRAIWRRKSFSKLYNMTRMKFQQKQARITEEILAVEKQQVGFEFLLIVTYCRDPKSAVLLIKLTSGDFDAFREFGKFFVTVIHHWCIELLKPHTKPVEKDMADKIAETIQYLDKSLITNDEEPASDEDTSSPSLNVTTGSEDGPDTTPDRHQPDTTPDRHEPDTT